MTARPAWVVAPVQFSVRLAAPDDRGGVAEFLAAMDHEGLYARHFAAGPGPNLALLDRLDRVDRHDRVVVVAVGPDGTVLGHAEYVAEHGAAEFAMMVLPQLRGCGVGSRMLDKLADLASVAGHRAMHGMIQSTNVPMLKLASSCGFRLRSGSERSTVIAIRELRDLRARDAGTHLEPAGVVSSNRIVTEPIQDVA